MSNVNSVSDYKRSSLETLQEALGTTQFSSSDVNSWYQIINGLIIQGGLSTGAGVVTFPAPLEKQVLGVFMNGATASGITLTGFTASASGFWWAIGV